MMLPHIGERFPTTGDHQAHSATIVAVDAHGQTSLDEVMLVPPTVVVQCSCGGRWTEDLIELAAPQRRSA